MPAQRSLFYIGSLTWVITIQAQIDRLPHADTTQGNYFGGAVAIDGSRILVGAHGEASCGTSGGAAYIFELQDATLSWNRVARLVPGDCRDGLDFGRAVALSGDKALIASTTEYFATAEGNAAYVFERDSSGNWLETAKLVPGSDLEEGPAGAAVGLHGDRAMITTWGDPAHQRFDGAAYIYERSDSSWELEARIDGAGRSGIFGGGGAMGPNVIVIPSSTYFQLQPGFAFILEPDAAGVWQQVLRIEDVDEFFVSVDVTGEHLVIGESRDGPHRSGIAAVYARDSTDTWLHAATLHPPTPYKDGSFGTAVAISTDRAIVSGYDEQLRLQYNVHRVVYVYALNDGEWQYKNIIDLGEVNFGSAVDIDGRVAVIGAASGDIHGAAYVVQLH